MLRDRQLKDMGLKEARNIFLMVIKDNNGETFQASGRAVLRENDIVIILEKHKDIKTPLKG